VFLNNIFPQPGKNWDETFRLLTNVMENVEKNKKIVLFFDELPWLASKKSRLLQTLDYYWNQYWSMDKRLKLVVCGSSASWIINKIINNRGGLHNRITESIHLEPFNLSETERFLTINGVHLNRKQITEIYMVTGGIPYYLSKIQPGLSSTQIIEKLAFDKKALLFNEFDNLFSALFDEYEACIEIIRTIAKHRAGIGQEKLFSMLKKTVKGNTGLTRLKTLEDAGFIISFTPHFHKKRGVYYRVIDEYSLFYLHWIEPLKETKMGNALSKDYWKTLTQTPQWFSWAGYAFEAICYKHLRQIRRTLDLSVIAIPNSWRYIPTKALESSGAQIDLLFDRPDDCITICEIKYSGHPFVIDKKYALSLENKVKVFQQQTRTKKHIFIAMITSHGVRKNNYAKRLVSNEVILDDLFQSV
jgi:uncharacterized protein